MKAVVYHGQEDFRVETVPDPELEQNTDVLVRIERAAICGSDLHLWHSPPGDENGFSVGHEFLGTIEEAGSAVKTVNPGERVLVSCTTGCGTCPSCRRGVYSGCPVTTKDFTTSNVFGFSNALPGGQAEAARVPFADVNCFRLPSSLSDEQCLFLTDILPTGYMGAEMADVGPGDTVAVFGCGPVGSFAQSSAQLRGASRVIAIDLDESRLERARRRGCATINPGTEDVVERILELSDGLGVDSAIEAVGIPELVMQAATVTRPGGRVAVIGVMLEPWQIEWPMFFAKNLTLSTGLVNPQIYIPKLLPLIERGILDPSEIISHRLPLDRAVEAYDIFANHRDNVLKVVLTP